MEIIRKPFYKFYWKMRDIIVPGLENSQYAYNHTLRAYVNQNSRWLDLGCGHQILPGWMPQSQEKQAAIVERSKMTVGLDYDCLSLRKHKTIKYGVVGTFEDRPSKTVHLSWSLLIWSLNTLKIPLRLWQRYIESWTKTASSFSIRQIC